MPGQVLRLVETAAKDATNRIGQALIHHAVTLSGDDASTGAPARCGCGRPARLVADRLRTIRTALGPVELRRRWWHCADCHTGFAPAERWWGISSTGHSAGYDKILAIAGADHPYRASATLISDLTGLDLACAATIGRTCRQVGDRAHAAADTENAAIRDGALTVLPPPGPTPELCYLLIDGTGAPMRPSETRDRPGKGADGRARTREVKIGCLFTQAEAAVKPDTHPVRDPGSASYIATFDDAAHFDQQLHTEYRRRGFDRIRQPIIIADGAKWIWAIAERRYPEATHIVDYWHAREHLHDLVKIFDHILSDPDTFTQQLTALLDDGNINGIRTTLNKLKLDTYTGKLADRTTKALAYFTDNAHRMNYHHYRANGWFIGSGPVEAACKTIVAQRAKQAGMRWTITGLQPILTLRTLTRSGRDHLICGNHVSQTSQPPAA